MKIYAKQDNTTDPIDRFVGKDLWFAINLNQGHPDRLGWYRIYSKDNNCYYYSFVDDMTLAWMFNYESPEYIANYVDNLLSSPRHRNIDSFNNIYQVYNASEAMTTAELFHLEDSGDV